MGSTLVAGLAFLSCFIGETESFIVTGPRYDRSHPYPPLSSNIPRPSTASASSSSSSIRPALSSSTRLHANNNPFNFWSKDKKPDGTGDDDDKKKGARSLPLRPTPTTSTTKDDDDDREKKGQGPLSGFQNALSGITESLYQPIELGPILGKIGIFVVGFVGGLGSGVVYFLEPYGSLSDSLIKPVTLFENVLVELDRGYVEKLDHDKLFETAVGSMLQSLDPYTEFEDKQLAQDMREAVSGRYGGVGLVIAGSKVTKPPTETTPTTTTLPPPPTDSTKEKPSPEEKGVGPISQDKKGDKKKAVDGAAGGFRNGITVVSAFEGYAYDAGMRVGDKLLAVDGVPVADLTVDQVRDLLRGAPDTTVRVSFQRPSLDGVQDVSLTRRLIRVPDVKLAAFLGDRSEGIGYIQLTGFSQGAAGEVQYALELLKQRAPGGLQGIILDLRGNPGGLLNSAVDVASLLVPPDSEIVSAKGRTFEPVSYSSSLSPARDNSVPLAILVNSATASAAEIVSGAVQDLDSGIIIGADRTFGKGLVQNVESLPYNTALKYTVAKYYTPSGRCIQSVKYSPPDPSKVLPKLENGGDKPNFSVREPTYEASKVPESERKSFRTLHGRVVRDGGGIEADIKVSSPEASLLEVTLLQQGAFFDYATEWAKTHQYKGEGMHVSPKAPTTPDTVVTKETYADFKRFVQKQVEKGDVKLDVIFSSYIDPLQEAFKEVKLEEAQRDLTLLRKSIRDELELEFTKNQPQISEQIEQAILARYVPESALRKKSLDNDPQIKKAVETLKNRKEYYAMLRPSRPPTLADMILQQIEQEKSMQQQQPETAPSS